MKNESSFHYHVSYNLFTAVLPITTNKPLPTPKEGVELE